MLETDPDKTVRVERLRLAAWLKLNGQKLLERQLQVDGKIIYIFVRTQHTDSLISQWEEKTPHGVILTQFSSIVSFEIQTAVRMRRAAGLSTRIRSVEKT